MSGRRLNRPAPRRRNDDERVLPLINVVFLLLVFFMVAGRLAATDPFEIEPLRSDSDTGADPDRLLLTLGADGDIAVNQERIDPADLSQVLEERLAAGDAAGVRVKADGRAEAVAVVRLMSTVRDAGAEQLDLLTVPAD